MLTIKNYHKLKGECIITHAFTESWKVWRMKETKTAYEMIIRHQEPFAFKYKGKELIININKILSIYPAEDNIGTMIHAENGQSTWKVLENIETVIKRVNE